MYTPQIFPLYLQYAATLPY